MERVEERVDVVALDIGGYILHIHILTMKYLDVKTLPC
jgi:hypothetical protein